MLIFPAIDLRRGRCVRLRQGDPTAETLYSEDPAAAARQWAAQGAQWLHVVNLDGAFGDEAGPAGAPLPINLQRLAEIRQAVDLPIQFGGGLRRLEEMAQALALGATRVVLGTVAVQQPQIVRAALARFGSERIVIGIDAREGRVATHGWAQTSSLEAVTLAIAMRAAGVQRMIYTDISRDGMLTGVNVAATAALARASGLAVIASGGVRDVADIALLAGQAQAGIEGVIIGQALYTGALSLAAALQAATPKTT